MKRLAEIIKPEVKAVLTEAVDKYANAIAWDRLVDSQHSYRRMQDAAGELLAMVKVVNAMYGTGFKVTETATGDAEYVGIATRWMEWLYQTEINEEEAR